MFFLFSFMLLGYWVVVTHEMLDFVCIDVSTCVCTCKKNFHQSALKVQRSRLEEYIVIVSIQFNMIGCVEMCQQDIQCGRW